MKVLKVRKFKSDAPVMVNDCYVGKGYLQGESGSLPDVDIDYPSDKRQEVKDYMKERYNTGGRTRVFSAGTFTTLKPKAVIKDVARTMRISPGTVNYITAIFDKESDYTSIFQLAAVNKRVGDFVRRYPTLFEDIRTLLLQPRSSSIHASALVVTPVEKDGEPMDCWDFTPIKKIDDMLVSEFSGVELDSCGLLKNDYLATKELSKLQQTMDLCNREYGTSLTLEELATGDCDDPAVFDLLSRGFTMDIFQFGSKGMTKFLMEMRPTCINDLIAANALFRPATLKNDSTTDYIDCKRGDRKPVYLWGTYNALKETYGLIVYQEEVVFIAREVGGFSLGDGVHLVKYISKKKLDKIQAMKQKFMTGAAKNGCPPDDAREIWAQIEACGSYLFNKSHAAAYAITSYASAYLKAHYPTAFFTTSLEWAESDEIARIMSEMNECSNTRVVPPDINKSHASFHTDFSTNEIYWSLSSIKMLGAKAVDWIIMERDKNGEFTGIENFIHRIFKYKLKKYEYWDDPDNEEEAVRCPVNARHIRNLIVAGCFDKVENAMSVAERYGIIRKAADILGFGISDKDFPPELVDKHYFWSQQQVAVSGLGAIDYQRIYDNSTLKQVLKHRCRYVSLKDVLFDENDGKRIVTAATIVDFTERHMTRRDTGKNEAYCKMTVQQNNDLCDCMVWPDDYARLRGKIIGAKGRIAVFNCIVKYSDFSGKNELVFSKSSEIEII